MKEKFVTNLNIIVNLSNQIRGALIQRAENKPFEPERVMPAQEDKVNYSQNNFP